VAGTGRVGAGLPRCGARRPGPSGPVRAAGSQAGRAPFRPGPVRPG